MTEDHEHEADAPEQDMLSQPEGFATSSDQDEAPEGVTSDQVEEAAEYDAEGEDGEAEFPAPVRPEPKLERLQKILAQAGVASRRHAEELITQGRVQVNGQVVMVLGSKADPKRDHIRVDGKLLRGAERLRYFLLNKPKGYVTTVTDPEGRPTVMEFFAKTGERLYPVGRLDFQSEGLLLVTNDGELANGLTKAAHGVEKTYLVKVAGQPDEAELDILRKGGVAIERGRPGEGKVRTAAARIRQVRQGENPWYEVVLIEGRNRELRKMFEEIGHHVEKIRRVGYGPLVLDVEPGKMRELEAEEVEALQLAAQGKLKPRRIRTSGMLPREAGQSAEEREFRAGKRGARPFNKRSFGKQTFNKERRPGREGSGGEKREARPYRRPEGRGEGPPREGFRRDSERRDSGRGSSRFEGREREREPRAQGQYRQREEGFRSRERERKPYGKPDDRPRGEERPRERQGDRGAGFGKRAEPASRGFQRDRGPSRPPRGEGFERERRGRDAGAARERAPEWRSKGPSRGGEGFDRERRGPSKEGSSRPAYGRSGGFSRPKDGRGSRPQGGSSRSGGPRGYGRGPRAEGSGTPEGSSRPKDEREGNERSGRPDSRGGPNRSSSRDSNRGPSRRSNRGPGRGSNRGSGPGGRPRSGGGGRSR